MKACGACSKQVHLVAGRQADVQADCQTRRWCFFNRGLHADGEVAHTRRTADRREQAAIADVAVRLTKEVRQGIGGAEALNGRIGDDGQIVRHEWHGDGDIETIGHAHRHEGGELGDRGFDRIDGRHHVLAAAAQLRAVVREDRRHLVQIQTFHGVEREMLRGEPERHAACTDGFSALGQDRAEALGGALEDAQAGIEAVCEARGGGRQWHRHELIHQGRVELAEIRLKVAVEMGRMRLFTR